MNKVRNGTPVHDGPSLCRTCRHATIVTGTKLNEEIVLCSELSRPYDRITFKVTECSSHDDKSRPSFGAMNQIAWELCTDRSGRRIGFLSPKDMRRRQEQLETLPYLEEPELIGKR